MAASAGEPPAKRQKAAAASGSCGVARLAKCPGDARAFFDAHVATRKPAHILAHPSDTGWRATERWTDAYLRAVAGGAAVRPEKRAPPAEGDGAAAVFGARSGDRLPPRPLAQFLDDLASGDDTQYLTTEAASLDARGRLLVASAPVPELLAAGDAPLRPALMGHLAPAAYNLWMGRDASTGGASSGLHHDWHDNLYVLLRGTKRFRIWPPTDTLEMKPRGKVAEVLPNGRIRYAGGERCREDGATARDARRVAEAELELAELALERAQADGACAKAEASAQAALAAAESRLDAALEFAIGDGGGAVLHNEGEGEEEDEGLDEDEVGDAGFLIEDDDYDDAAFEGTDDYEEGAGGDGGSSGDEGRNGAGGGEDAELPHFSSLDARDVKTPCVEVTVRAGEMLYLPAGWWHEVTSFSGDAGAHMAFNYWFHPPSSGSTFESPYPDDLWERDWALWARESGLRDDSIQ